MAENFLTPVTKTTLTADICRKLVSHLIRGDWVEGEKLPVERELCQRLGVGRASLREALKALEIMGMIETRLGEGTFVCGRSEFFSRPLLWAITGSTDAEANELVESRLVLEVALASCAAERATADELQSIAGCLDDMDRAVDNPADFLEADLSFHLAIGKAAKNRILFNALHLIRNLMRQWISSTLQQQGVAELATKQHREIFLAIEERNRIGAQNAMREHLESMAQALRRSQATGRTVPINASSDFSRTMVLGKDST